MLVPCEAATSQSGGPSGTSRPEGLSGSGGSSGSSQSDSLQPTATRSSLSNPSLSQVLQELNNLKDEYKSALGKVQEEQRKMGNALVKALDAAFTIEESPYKVIIRF